MVNLFGGSKNFLFSSSFYTHHKQEKFSSVLMKHFGFVTQGKKK